MSRRVRLRIRYDGRSGLGGLLTLALLVTIFLGYLAWNQHEAAASGPQVPLDHAQNRPLAASTSLRGYYLTQSTYNGAEAAGTDGNGAGVCATGYHMASLWEIMNPANLKYNIALGRTRDDSGQGPPAAFGGWVHTGYSSSASSTPGWGNCSAWTSSDVSHRGTVVYLPVNWTAAQDIYIWEVDVSMCSLNRSVWCVADDVSIPVYLPIVVKNH